MESLPDLSDDYEVLACLGYGARSAIYVASDRESGQLYALKRVIRRTDEDDRFLEQAEQEYSISSQFNHPSLRKTHRIIRKRKLLKVNELLLVMDLFDGSPLDTHRPTDLLALVKIFCQVARGLDALHRIGYVHADIKPNNILLNDQTEIKIIDFGQSCPIGTVKQRVQGTPDYIAPEQVTRGPLTPATDVFNLGATFYWCLTNQHIPTLISKKKGTSNYTQDAPSPPNQFNAQIPLALSNLVMDCVALRPSDRPMDMNAVLTRLEMVSSILESAASGHKSTLPDSTLTELDAGTESKDLSAASGSLSAIMEAIDEEITEQE